MGGRGHTLGVQGGKAFGMPQNGPEIPGHTRDLLFGECEPREGDDTFHLIASDLRHGGKVA